MTKDTPTNKPSSGEDTNDPEVAELEKQIARLAARQKLLAARFGAFGSLTPGVSDAPLNTVTFGDKAGSLAPWLAQSVLAELAASISTAVWKNLHSNPTGREEESSAGQSSDHDATKGKAAESTSNEHAEAKMEAARSEAHVVFVTEDPDLLSSDVVSQQVNLAMRARTTELEQRAGALKGALTELTQAVNKYLRDEECPPEQSSSGLGRTRHLFQSALTDAATAAAEAGTEATAVQTAVGDGATAAAAAATAAAEDGGVGTQAGDGTTAAGAGPIGAAVDLVRLLGVDYTIKTAEVAVDSALLARLTAGRLAMSESKKSCDEVLLDGFALAEDSATLKNYWALFAVLNNVEGAIQELARAVAPVTAEAKVYQGRVEDTEESLAKTQADPDADEGADDEALQSGKSLAQPHADPDADKGAAEALQIAQEFRRRFEARNRAAEPAEVLMTACKEAVTAVRAELLTLGAADTSGVSPLQRACSRDRLHSRTGTDPKAVSHVLLVQATHAGADVVTRRSILGASGRVGYLGGANGAWVMVKTNGTVAGGGAVEAASHLAHDIASGESAKNPIKPATGKLTGKDPLEKNEKWIRLGVLLLALAIVLAGVVAPIALYFVAVK